MSEIHFSRCLVLSLSISLSSSVSCCTASGPCEVDDMKPAGMTDSFRDRDLIVIP